MFRKLFALVAGLIVLLIVVALAVPMFVNAEKLKAPLLQQVESATGYRVSIGGKMSFHLFPLAEIHLAQVSVATPQAPTVPFAQIEDIDVGVKFMPLLHGQVELDHLSLSKPQFALKHTANGDNWQPQRSANAAPAPVTSKKSGGGNAQNTAAMLLGNIKISDGLISYEDTVTKQKTVLSAFNLKAGMSSLSSPYKLAIDATLNGKPLSFKTEIGSVGALMSGKTSALNVKLEAEGKKAAIDGKFSMSNSRYALTDSTIDLDGTQLNGSIKADMTGAKPSVAADLTTKQLDATPYMAKKTASLSLISDALAAEERWSSAPIDLSFLNSMNMLLNLKADRFIADKLEMAGIAMKARIDNGVLSLNMSDVKLYSGTASVDMGLNASGALDAKVSAANIQIQPLMKALATNDAISGTTALHLNITGSAKSVATLISTLGGNGDIRITDGSIRGADIAGMVRNVKSAFTGAASSQQKTDFTEMGGTFTIANGIITNNDLAMKAPLLRLTGKGTVNLPSYTIDYMLTPEIVGTMKGQGGADKSGLAIPIKVSGSLDNPNYAPDLASVVNEAIKNPEQMKEKVKDVKQMIKGKNLKGLLKGL